VLMTRMMNFTFRPFDSAHTCPAKLAALGGMVSRCTFLGVILGLAALTKQSALAFLPAAALAVAWTAGTRREAIKRMLLLALPLVLVAGWWYLHNALSYGDPLGFTPHRPPTENWQPPLSLLLRQLGQALRGYWGAFGWGLILVEPLIYVLIAAFVLLGLLGWLRRGTESRGHMAENKRRVVVVLGLGVLLNLVGLALWLWRTSAPYGRLLYPASGPLAVLLVLGWRRWLNDRYTRLFVWVVVGVMGLYAVVVPFRYLQPAYASPVVSLSASLDAMPLDVQFDQVIDLLGYRIVPEDAFPGAPGAHALLANDNDVDGQPDHFCSACTEGCGATRGRSGRFFGQLALPDQRVATR